MTGTAGRCDAERFRAVVAQLLGLHFDDAKLDLLGRVLCRRRTRTNTTLEGYLAGLQRQPGGAELTALAEQLTVGETYFFRDNAQFRAFAEVALPARRQAATPSRSLRILSAGCASGEEAYSIAIAAREAIPDPACDIAVLAVDLNAAALEKAGLARYTAWSFRETPEELRQRWFRRGGDALVVVPAIRQAVRFECRNLADGSDALWQSGPFDAVFCRNVIMYFAPDQARALIARIAQSLHPGGCLFLGHAETLRGLSDDFMLQHTHGTFYYTSKGQAATRPPHHAVTIAAPQGDAAACDEDWVETIRVASGRVAALAVPANPASPDHADRTPGDLAGIFALMRSERFGAALDLLRQRPAVDGDPGRLLLEAALLANSGAIKAAEAASRHLLREDGLNAAAHYVLALCRERAGDAAAAADCDRVASYLDPGFAMPRLHLAMLARRGGDRPAARRELAQAMVLLQREEPTRLLLFGGGFDRDALIALCASAWRDCGGQR